MIRAQCNAMQCTVFKIKAKTETKTYSVQNLEHNSTSNDTTPVNLFGEGGEQN